MPRFLSEPDHQHGAVLKTAVLLVNLGTPDAPTSQAVRRYLRQFLSDPRVIEAPRAVWLPVLYGVILVTRPKQSAHRYARIWSTDGSPLKVHTDRQARILASHLHSEIHSPLVVEYAMRYGEPSIRHMLARLKSEGCERILVVPMYPQYSASTTASVFDEVAGYLRQVRSAPEIRTIKTFHDHPAYIGALAASVREHWEKWGRPERLVVSFHGLPQFSVVRGDPYHSECQKTARLLAQQLQLADGQWQIAFQSRFGRLEWLKPYTASTLAELGRKGARRVDLICPGFVCDCLETLEEIGIEGKEIFIGAGGKEFHLLPCLNEREDWICALAGIAREHLAGWVGGPWDKQSARDAAEQGRAPSLASDA